MTKMFHNLGNKFTGRNINQEGKLGGPEVKA
jgi:hypothetical protein